GARPRFLQSVGGHLGFSCTAVAAAYERTGRGRQPGGAANSSRRRRGPRSPPVNYASRSAVARGMTRNFYLYLSQQQRLRRWMETSPVARKLTRRFIAGETLEDALKVSTELQGQGILTALDHLGENVTSLDEAAAS